MKRLFMVVLVLMFVMFSSVLMFAGEDDNNMPNDDLINVLEGLDKIPSTQGVDFWGNIEKLAHIKGQKAKFSPTIIKFDESVLSSNDKKVLGYLVEAAGYMNEIYLRQVYSKNFEIREKLKKSRNPLDKTLLSYFLICFGPFDVLDENKNFVGNEVAPDGAGFYPLDMTKDEFNNWIKNHPEDKEAFDGWYTVIRRKGDKLVAVPYSVEYKDLLEKSASALNKAAELTENKSLKLFLEKRAKAFLTDRYFESELCWMDLKDSIFEVVIGPYEVYTDKLFNNKTAFEAFICYNDPNEAKKLEKYAGYLREMEENLPISDEYKNFNRSFESPIRVVQEIYTSGDTRAGIQTSAFNLPNDEKVRETKGCKKVMLKNVMEAKFNKSLIPISKRVIEPSQLQYVTFEAYFNHVVFHELSHGLGPGIIEKNGKKIDTRVELQEFYSIIEEAKADTLGAYNELYLMDKGVISESARKQLYVTYLAGLFRSIRFGMNEAHGKANIIQFNWFLKNKAINYDSKTGYYSVDFEKFTPALKSLVKELLMIEALGDYEMAKKLSTEYGKPPLYIIETLKKLEDIPVDIEPIFEVEKK